ncbi:DUF1127 domain-containing protein [Jannaschia seohaensis]|uniref:Uncharacterized conserved protein YjiS, DUF1127 family n=1 Tax=Jannaschia seohaensis TaxID=475081 RepID=A0A2Y9B6I6_9RHOB|nr:hypothetical protein [Jannaschia seohaensis]PWJ13311.1 uncharacterized protein YjiS (DUF1127 family) [Jannaschia seohaensis]SSA50637.1 Uncharacterized conserved protein YjiS, DUF1127 family [Jannaschia seohaensis]
MTALAFTHPSLNAHAAPARSPLSRGLAALAQTVAIWEMRAATRRALKDMDPSRYPDLGLTTAEVLREVEKPFWVA